VNPKEDKPVQIAMALREAVGSPRILMNSLVNPCRPIEPGATEVHGITSEKVVLAPDYAIAAWQAKLLAESLQPDLLVTFNGSQFDLPIIKACIGGSFLEGTPHLDLLDVAYRHFPTSESFKLGALYQKLSGKSLEGAHDAIIDVIATLELYHLMMNSIMKEARQLIEEMKTPKPYEIFPISKKHKGKPLSEVPKSFARWLFNENVKNGTTMRPDLQLSVEQILSR
jgi:DNA polymerase III epsilon subunit-like protein